MYVQPNFKTKKALKTALAENQPITVFSPGIFPCPSNGRVAIEGPHYPKPHTWYAVVEVSNYRVVRVIS